MGCTNTKNNSGINSQFEAEVVNEINLNRDISEPSTISYPIAFGKNSNTKELTKGSYKISGEIGSVAREPLTVFDKEIIVQTDEGPKRIYIHRLQVDRAELVTDDDRGSKYTMTFTVIDNPIPVVAIVYALGTIGSLTAGYFFVDRVDKFTSSTTGGLLTLLLAGAGVYFAYIKR